MGDLSKNFSQWEFECKCGCGFNSVDPRLVESLQRLRDLLGVPINVNSACRCETYNRKKGGEKDSQHLKGLAVDIWCKGLKPRRIAEIAEQIPEFRNGGIGIYKTFVHLDVRMNGPARWGKRLKKRKLKKRGGD
jgi:zinc D-Ala-D-Ala carboxypeptidase